MRKEWTKDEVEFLKNNYRVMSRKKLAEALQRSKGSISYKASTLNLQSKRYWTKKELEYLEENWGVVSLPTMAKRLGRSVEALKLKAGRLELGPFLDNGEYVTLNQLFICLGRGKSYSYGRDQWVNMGLPVKRKRVAKNSFQVIFLDEFWEWAQANQTLIDFSRLEEWILGKEPDWLKEQRKNDIQMRQNYKTDPWTAVEDRELERLVKLHRYGYREISMKLRRTEGALKRRLQNLGIKERPIRRSPHEKWTPEQLRVLKELYNKGYDKNLICFYIEGKSAHACGGKIEVLIRQGELYPRSEFRVSC